MVKDRSYIYTILVCNWLPSYVRIYVLYAHIYVLDKSLNVEDMPVKDSSMMYAFIETLAALIHHSCSAVDGMLVERLYYAVAVIKTQSITLFILKG